MDLDTVSGLAPAPGAVWRAGDAWLAGGTWLFSQPQPDLDRLLDLRDFGWPSLVSTDRGLEIAATCTLAELARWDGPELVRQCCEALLGSVKVWNAATVGGNVCLALPAGPMTALTAALGGVATLWFPSADLPVVDLVTGPSETVLVPGQLLRSIQLPGALLEARTAFRQISLTPQGRSAALVIARADRDAITVTVTASTPRPVQFACRSVAEALAEVSTITDWYADVHGDPRWRAAMTRRLVGEVVAELGG